MDTKVESGVDAIVTEFAAWVKSVQSKAAQMKDEQDVARLETQLAAPK